MAAAPVTGAPTTDFGAIRDKFQDKVDEKAKERFELIKEREEAKGPDPRPRPPIG